MRQGENVNRFDIFESPQTEYDLAMVVKKLRARGYRVTKQRELILELMLKYPNKKCKEIYTMANSVDGEIGVSTIYRMKNLLEEIGIK